MRFLNESAIQQVMNDTGMDYVQARNNVLQRTFLTERREVERFPLGYNNSIDHDVEYAAWAKRNPELAAAQNPVPPL